MWAAVLSLTTLFSELLTASFSVFITSQLYLDCYVAVTGLPEPRKDHAVAMARFARDCLVKMRYLCKKLEVTLGEC